MLRQSVCKKTAAAKELKRKDPVDAPDEVAESEAGKRSRVERPKGAGDGKRLKIKQTGTAQLKKAQADRELDAGREKADAKEQANARQRARADERREQREADRRWQELEERLQNEANEAVRRAVQDAKTAAAAVIEKIVTSFMNTANTTVDDLSTAAVQRRHARGEQE
ncbi:hypothetical protein E2P81_ATG10733 [Venturia nashicola]|nr:hypothetical protein E2P81_ATG10733 [Venturia nashicola]